MRRIPEIRPITDLCRDATSMLKSVWASGEPLIITHRGRPAAVLLSIDAYKRAERERELLMGLARGSEEITTKQGHGLDEVLAQADTLL